MAKKERNLRNKERQVPFFSSLSTQMTILIFIMVLLSVSATGYVALCKMQEACTDIMSRYALTMTKDAANAIDSTVLPWSPVSTSLCESIVGDSKLSGVDSSYFYVVLKDGTMLYHPTTEKIGQPVENASIKEVLARWQSGEEIVSGQASYDYKGVRKYAFYSVTNCNALVILTADYDDMISFVTSSEKDVNRLNLAILIAMVLIGFLFSKLFLKPIPTIVKIVNDTAELDFRENPQMVALLKRKDEIGVIAKSVRDMRSNLREIVHTIENASGTIDENIDSLNESTIQVNSTCTDNSASTQELAASMEETCATTESVNMNIQDMFAKAKDMDQLAMNGNELSIHVSERANNLKTTTVTATENTQIMYASVKEKADAAIDNSKVVYRINEMTTQIMDISSQTSLLALNASIEAARAGDSGRGFAVVATEIGKLAMQTSQAVSDIDVMVRDVIACVKQMQECLEETTDFIGNQVIADYKGFGEVSEQYNQDAGAFKSSMAEIRSSIEQLSKTMGVVASCVDEISGTIGEAANGVNGIAENTSDIVMLTETTAQKAVDCKNEVEDLRRIVERFTLS